MLSQDLIGAEIIDTGYVNEEESKVESILLKLKNGKQVRLWATDYGDNILIRYVK